jgi:UDP-3-O-[3-hydroxymyristoyl] glucosamine N-acyltransferase
MLLKELAQQFNAEIYGKDSVDIQYVAALEDAKTNDISFISNRKYLKHVLSTNAAAVVMSKQDLDYCLDYHAESCKNLNALLSSNPYATFARISQYLVQIKNAHVPIKEACIHASAVIHPSVIIGENVTIDAFVCIEEGVIIANNVHIYAGCYIGKNVEVGEHTLLYAHVTIYHGCKIGEHVIIHSGTVVGSDGFGFAPDLQSKHPEWVKIPQIGYVVIQNHVEIGANTSIDRATFGQTLIEQGTKIDNQVQIAHNVHIGKYCVIAGCTAIAGSTSIGNFCMIGGSSEIAGHLEIADACIISGATSVMQSTQKGQHITGVMPAMEHKQWEKNAVIIRQLSNLRKQLKDLYIK